MAAINSPQASRRAPDAMLDAAVQGAEKRGNGRRPRRRRAPSRPVSEVTVHATRYLVQAFRVLLGTLFRIEEAGA
jgi:hypothetical protein